MLAGIIKKKKMLNKTIYILVTLFILSACKSIEPKIKYYEKDGEQWYQKNIYCYPKGKYPSTKGKRKLAKVQQYKGTQLYESIVYYEFWPNGESKFVSKDGFYKFKNGKNQLFIDSIVIPDNIIVQTLDSINNIVTYYYRNGKQELYIQGKMDGIKETIYEGDKPGVYEWKNGEKIFIRELNSNEIEEKRLLEEKINKK
jgi:hypothetical protein